jgi:hypothetical protein
MKVTTRQSDGDTAVVRREQERHLNLNRREGCARCSLQLTDNLLKIGISQQRQPPQREVA